jgi:hypothetical protein
MRAVVLAALSWPPLCALVFAVWRSYEIGQRPSAIQTLAWVAAQGGLLLGVEGLVDARAGKRDAGGDGWIAVGLAVTVLGQIAVFALTETMAATWELHAAGPRLPLVLVGLTGAWQWSVAEVAIASRREPAHDAVDAAVRSLAAALATSHPALWIVMALMGGDTPAASTLWMVIAGLLPAAAALPSVVRLLARKCWLARVAAGLVEGWRIEEAGVPDLAGLVPLGPSIIVGRPAVLVATSRTAGPFRAAGRGIPVALVPLRS